MKINQEYFYCTVSSGNLFVYTATVTGMILRGGGESEIEFVTGRMPPKECRKTLSVFTRDYKPTKSDAVKYCLEIIQDKIDEMSESLKKEMQLKESIRAQGRKILEDDE